MTSNPKDKVCYLCKLTEREQQYLKALEEDNTNDAVKCEECCSPQLSHGVLDTLLRENEELQRDVMNFRLQLHDEESMTKLLNTLKKERKMQNAIVEREKLVREEEERANRALKQTLLTLRMELAAREKEANSFRKQLRNCTCTRLPRIGTGVSQMDAVLDLYDSYTPTLNAHRLSVESFTSSTIDTIGEEELDESRMYPCKLPRYLQQQVSQLHGTDTRSFSSPDNEHEDDNVDEDNDEGEFYEAPAPAATPTYDSAASFGRGFRPLATTGPTPLSTPLDAAILPPMSIGGFSRKVGATMSSRSLPANTGLSTSVYEKDRLRVPEPPPRPIISDSSRPSSSTPSPNPLSPGYLAYNRGRGR
eukprot:CAMPEP_0184671946 /NCGR_PEP_ID=MMETSP0308-20130426/85769_1 /TAXON_ID=38269 /ORGANISM="Gloeochaete witrockiana, Strain SAG 46.84" /LENGTH=361 /DNA_ID=CAMNT_0027119173 /DNA_START=152 /DNA_END=1237 /DNA_ORIENTATION=-